MCICVHACICACVHACVHVCVHTRVRFCALTQCIIVCVKHKTFLSRPLLLKYYFFEKHYKNGPSILESGWNSISLLVLAVRFEIPKTMRLNKLGLKCQASKHSITYSMASHSATVNQNGGDPTCYPPHLNPKAH